MSKFIKWKRNQFLMENEEYIGNNLLLNNLAEHGFDSIISKYTYIHPEEVEDIFSRIPEARSISGVSVDLGGGLDVFPLRSPKKRMYPKYIVWRLPRLQLLYANR